MSASYLVYSAIMMMAHVFHLGGGRSPEGESRRVNAVGTSINASRRWEPLRNSISGATSSVCAECMFVHNTSISSLCGSNNGGKHHVIKSCQQCKACGGRFPSPESFVTLELHNRLQRKKMVTGLSTSDSYSQSAMRSRSRKFTALRTTMG